MLKSGIYDFVICRGGTDMCFVLGFGRQRPDLKQYRISGLTACSTRDYKTRGESHAWAGPAWGARWTSSDTKKGTLGIRMQYKLLAGQATCVVTKATTCLGHGFGLG